MAPAPSWGGRMFTCTYNILDDRFQTPTVEYVTVKDLGRARSLAGERLMLSPHHKSVTAYKNDVELFRIDRRSVARRLPIT
jgi:hypothetical protein